MGDLEEVLELLVDRVDDDDLESNCYFLNHTSRFILLDHVPVSNHT